MRLFQHFDLRTLVPVLFVAIAGLSATGAVAADFGFFGWGPRLGVGDDPNQILIGVHQDLGEFTKNLRFQPSIDLGVGDDQTLLTGILPVHYRFSGTKSTTPYLGAGLRLAWIDRDRPRGDDSDFDAGPILVGGVEWGATDRSDALLEVQFGGDDGHDVRVVLGWMFRAR